MNKKSMVTIAGAGSGDVELITLKLYNRLQIAEVIIVDRLVNPEIISMFANPNATIIFTYKAGYNKDSITQQEINDLMVLYAKKDKQILRLKGGDISIFSNILSELETLVKNNIKFELIPGITAASAAAAYTGIPLTARGFTKSVRFLSNEDIELFDHTFLNDIAHTNDTIVLYMGVKNLQYLIDIFVQLFPTIKKPIAIIEQASTKHQQVHSFCISTSPPPLFFEKITTPAIIFIGDVVGLYPSFNWFNPAEISGTVFPKIISTNNPTINELNPDKITIIFGTETGNSKKVAQQMLNFFKQKGFRVVVLDLSEITVSQLLKNQFICIIISTQGEGEPPLECKAIFDSLMQENATIQHVNYAVLGLGDSAYPLFCKAGKDIDSKLAALGANRLLPMVSCDVDYEQDSTNWFNDILHILSNDKTSKNAHSIEKSVPKNNTKNKYVGTIVNHIDLNYNNPNKQTYHIEIACDETPLYEPGDSIGIVPTNETETVLKILDIVHIKNDHIISTSKYTDTLYNLLLKKLNIRYLLKSTIQKYASIVDKNIPDTRLDLIDLLSLYPVQNTQQFYQIIEILNPISPRLYTIASAPAVHENQIHILVDKKYFLNFDNQNRVGLCSNYLSQFNKNNQIEFYVHKNKSFKLPPNDTDIIMIGNGTGIAAFRSFVTQRNYAGATGKNWLFFGNQYFTKDFFYQLEWQQFLLENGLHKINLTWSKEKINNFYIQDEVLKNGTEIMDWFNNGAHIYISGDKNKMAVEVENTLLNIISNNKNLTIDESKKYLKNLASIGRYEKDVY